MEFVTLPTGLFLFYGALVLGCGTVLGAIFGRNSVRRALTSPPQPPELIERRVAQLEDEIDAAHAALLRLTEEREFMRELRPPRAAAA